MTADVVIAGAGLAGASAALVLSRDRRVVVLDADGAGASRAAAGIVNPFMGRKARPAWRMEAALAALDALIEAADAEPLVHRTGVVRPADAGTRAAFEARAAAHPEALSWVAPEATAERWPAISAPHGALFVRRGCHVDLGALVGALLAAAAARGATLLPGRRLAGWRREGEVSVAITDEGAVSGRHLLLALGDGARAVPALAPLPLHRVKGQVLRLTRPAGLPPDLPAVSGHGYVAASPASVVVGATFEHAFATGDPDPALDAGLRARAARLVPALAEAGVLERRAGVRLTVPAAVSPGRLPLAGPLPGHEGVWVLTGLGAKGLLTAPLLALRCPDALDGRRPFPADVETRTRLGRGE